MLWGCPGGRQGVWARGKTLGDRSHAARGYPPSVGRMMAEAEYAIAMRFATLR